MDNYKIFRKELKVVERYAIFLRGLNRTTKEQEVLPGHREQEPLIRADPTCEVLCSIRMPPNMQALRIEEDNLCHQIQWRVRIGGIGTPAHLLLLEKVRAVRALIERWAEDELTDRPKVMSKKGERKIFPYIGADWHMLMCVEKIISE